MYNQYTDHQTERINAPQTLTTFVESRVHPTKHNFGSLFSRSAIAEALGRFRYLISKVGKSTDHLQTFTFLQLSFLPSSRLLL